MGSSNYYPIFLFKELNLILLIQNDQEFENSGIKHNTVISKEWLARGYKAEIIYLYVNMYNTYMLGF